MFALCFGFVSGHDFSRAIKHAREFRFSPCGSFSEKNALVKIASVQVRRGRG
jgi:hypothetical protein